MATATQTEPLFISVAEAARLLGISRSHAYEQAHLGLETDGEQGLPAIRLGRRLLVSRRTLELLTSAAATAELPTGPPRPRC